MQINTKPASRHTHEGGRAKQINAELQLRRSVMACLLWENSFYESGVDIAQRIIDLIPSVKPEACARIAMEAREDMKLRHVPLLIARAMASLPLHKGKVATVLESIIQRPDEITEFLAIYWKDGRCPVSAQVKKGLAAAFQKFDAYQLAKYNRDGAAVKLRDALFLCHAVAKNDQQAADWKKLIAGELQPPDTWEVALSSGADKRETWMRLMREDRLGALALLRNLRGMLDAKVDISVKPAITLNPRPGATDSKGDSRDSG